MSRRLYFLLLTLLGLTLISCSGQKFTVAPEYRDRKINDGNLLIPTIDKIIINQDDKFFTDDDLVKIEGECFKLMGNNFKDYLKANSAFQHVNYIELKNKPDFDAQILDLNNDDRIYLNVPKAPVEINIPGKMFLLFLQDVSLSLSKESRDTSDPAKHYDISASDTHDIKITNSKNFNYYLIFQMKYLIYDNANGKIVSYGSSSVKQKYDLTQNVDDLVIKAIEKISKEVVAKTPFEK
jgi:hypothetical protein